jgi:hypothetical protein
VVSSTNLTLLAAGLALGAGATYLICRVLFGARLETARVEARMTREHAVDGERRLKEAIDSLCAEALRQNNAQFLTLARTELERVRAEAAGDLDQTGHAIAEFLAPIRDGLAHYENKISEIERARERSFGEIVVAARSAAWRASGSTASRRWANCTVEWAMGSRRLCARTTRA